MNYWLMKTEPETYSWEDLVEDRRTEWSGIRNYQARNNMVAMKKGDLVLIYHSVKEKTLMGIAEVVKEAYPDHTAKEGDWKMVDIQAVQALSRPVALKEVKENPKLKNMVLVKNSRLSVQPVTKMEWEECMRMSGTRLD